MRFANIHLLFLVWAIPVLAVFFIRGMRRRHAILKRYARFKGRSAIASQAGSRRRWIKAGLLLGAVLFAAVALSGPQYGYQWQKIERKGIDMIIALDCSKSMLATDIQPSRLDRAKREILDLLRLLKGDRAGLVAFAGTAFLQCPMTIDYDAFHLFLNVLSPDFLPVGGTDLAGAIQTAVSGFDPEADADKAIILITDGESTGGDPVEAAEAAAKAGIKLFCIGVGKPEGIPIPDADGGYKKDAAGKIILTKIDEETLKKIAVMTGGTYVRSVAGDMDLDVLYTKEIKGKLQAATLSSGRKKVWEDRYQWFLGLAVVCMMAELFIPSIRKVIPMVVVSFFLLTAAPVAQADSVQKSLRSGLDAYEKGNYESALNHFIKAQLNDPERSEIYYNLGNTYYKLEQFENARANFDKATATENSSLREKALYNLGNTQFRLGESKAALSSYEAALKIDAEDSLARDNLAFVKKVMEQQQKQPPQNQPSDSDDHQKQNQDSQKSSENNAEQNPEKQNQEKRNSSQDSNNPNDTPQSGDPSRSSDDARNEQAPNANQDQAADEENPVPPPQPDPQDTEPAEAQKPTGGQTQPQPPDKTDGSNGAARMLNRLQDKPGRAMIPAYRQRVTEKDW